MLKYAAMILALCIGCGSSGGDDSGNGDGNGDGNPTGTLELTLADRSGVGPCPSQSILSNMPDLDMLKAALNGGTYSFLDVPFNGADNDIFRRKCGIEGFWDPTKNVNTVPAPGAITVSMFFNQGNMGICANGFGHGSFGTGEGFPATGTYRYEFKVAQGGTTWHVRGRAIASGSAAGNTFASESIAMATQLSDGTLVYSVNGSDVSHANLLAAAVAALSADGDNAPGFTLTVRRASGGGTIFTAVIELICATKTT